MKKLKQGTFYLTRNRNGKYELWFGPKPKYVRDWGGWADDKNEDYTDICNPVFIRLTKKQFRGGPKGIRTIRFKVTRR